MNTNSTIPFELNNDANGNPEPEMLSAATVISEAVLPTSKNETIIVTIRVTTPTMIAAGLRAQRGFFKAKAFAKKAKRAVRKTGIRFEF